MKTHRASLAALAWAVGIAGAAAQDLKQQAPDQTTTPKTKLEAFTGETGAVVIKGYTDLAKIQSLGSIEVTAMTFKNAKTGDESKGLAISLQEPNAYARSSSRAFIDYDEIGSLLAGIDYVAKSDASITKLANFEATYSTKGSFKITVFNNSSGVNQVNVRASSYGSGIFLKMPDLAKLRENIQAAKYILDNPDSVAAKGSRLNPIVSPAIMSVPSTQVQIPAKPLRSVAKPKRDSSPPVQLQPTLSR